MSRRGRSPASGFDTHRDSIRSYFGGQIAFYFAWAETYTVWLLSIMWAGVLAWLAGFSSALEDIAVPCYAVFLALSIAFFNKFWLRRRVGLCHTWCGVRCVLSGGRFGWDSPM